MQIAAVNGAVVVVATGDSEGGIASFASVNVRGTFQIGVIIGVSSRVH